MSRFLYTVEEVFSNAGYLFVNQKQFYNIPPYQRGYKWEAKHIIKLLKDIDSFEPSAGKFYCLQNITIIPQVDCFNVVDGQQRLTTLTLLLSYLDEKQLVAQKVRFPKNSIRQQTNLFLQEIITNEDVEFPDEDWDYFVSGEKEYDHQDISYLYRGFQTIAEWFDAYTGDIREFKDKLLHHVKLIINLIESSSSEEKIFGNLNSKRVPLDGADLIRAMLITRVAKEEGRRESDIKNIVRVNERRVKIGWELDQINQWWTQNEIIQYFSSFIRIESEKTASGDKIFNEQLYPLNYLYLFFAEKNQASELTLELIEERNNDALGLYKELLKLHNTLQDWYGDKIIYHYLGFLFNNDNKQDFDFGKAWKLWTVASTRDDFIASLKAEIKRSLSTNGELADYTDETVNWYQDQPKLLVKTLILMDIIHCLKKDRENLPVTCFTKSNNDIEHIFPKTPETITEIKPYIEFLNTHVIKETKDRFDLSDWDRRRNEEDYISDAEQFIEDQLSNIKVNSIGNLVLLYSSLNRSIKNAIYAIKRGRIIEYFQQGHYIQPHTFQVFIRYFNDVNNRNFDVKHWTVNDIQANAAFIQNKISAFFK